MKRMYRTVMFAFCGIVALGSGADAQGVKGTCRSDYVNSRLVEFFQGVVAPTTAGDSAIRQTLGLTGVTPAQVTVVTDATTCTKAASALSKLAEVPKSTYSLNVVRVGTSYAVFDPTRATGQWEPVSVFDSRWRLLETYLNF
jgi:hypothetical protein